MKIALIQTGKTTHKMFADIVDEYANRLKHYVPLEIVTVRDLKDTKSLSQQQIKQKEGELIISALQDGDYVVLLDEHGKEMRSIEFASWMEKRIAASPRRLVFIIGGPYGFSQDVYNIAHDKLSLSKMTFSHQMIRMIFVEQLYRAMTIIKKEKYHHE